MGIYPESKFQTEGKYLVNIYNGFDGAITKTYYEPVLEITERKNCFCCSCPDGDGGDWACRNHGNGWGERPCEVHNMPGYGIDPDTEEEFPIASVQWVRFRHQWTEQMWDPETLDTRHTGEMFQNRCMIKDPHSHWPKNPNR